MFERFLMGCPDVFDERWGGVLVFISILDDILQNYDQEVDMSGF